MKTITISVLTAAALLDYLESDGECTFGIEATRDELKNELNKLKQKGK